MWPKCLPKKAVSYLEKTVIPSAQKRKASQPTLKHKDMVDDAKRIESASRRLLKNLRDFEKHYIDSQYENHKQKADSLLKDHLEADELKTARLAFSQHSCQFVFLGLQARMKALQTPGKPGREKNYLSRALKEDIEFVFNKLNLPVGKSEDFKQALGYALEVSEIKADVEALTKLKRSEGPISQIEKTIKNKT